MPKTICRPLPYSKVIGSRNITSLVTGKEHELVEEAK